MKVITILSRAIVAMVVLFNLSHVSANDSSPTLEDLYWQHQGNIPIWLGKLIFGEFYHRVYFALQEPQPELDRGIVYTRQPRAVIPVPNSPLVNAANWQHASDVGRINGGIAESDVVLDDLDGNTVVIHNCTRTEVVCAAQEARVSPDGTRIVYSVGYGNKLVEVRAHGINLGIKEIPGLTHAKLFIHDLNTGVSKPVPNHDGRSIDRQPEWLDNETLVFASNRGNVYPHKTQFSQHRGTDADGNRRSRGADFGVSQPYGYSDAGRAMQIWTMKTDGTGARNISPHETMALSPTVMTNGDIVYSCWNGHANEAFDAATRHTNRPTTEVNKWWLCRTDGNGAGGDVILNGHKSPLLKTRGWLPGGVSGGEGASELRAVRSAAEIRKDYLAMTNYYRSNHVGSMGIIYGMTYRNDGVEGVSRLNNFKHRVYHSDREGSGRYIPSDFIALTPYGNDADVQARRNRRGKIFGKTGYASPLPGTNDFMITAARGLCYEGVLPQQANREFTGGEPVCMKGIYRVKTEQITNPFDWRTMELLAGGPRWHVFDADAVVTYQELWGQPEPDRPEPLTGDECYLQVVDGRAAELQPAQPYDWAKTLYEQCSSQGCAVNSEDKNFHRENMHFLTVYEVEMWDRTYAGEHRHEFGNTINNHGFKSLRVWGYQPLEEDGSVRMQVPCETPIQIVGQDADTMTVAHDDKLHSLRRGETRTCHGCHDGHSEERAAELGASAEYRFTRTRAAKTDHPPPDNGYRVTWRDVEPIILNRCSGCHGDMTNHDGLLDSRISWDYEQIDWPWAVRQPTFDGSYQLPRPYTSKWTAKLARQSLLYWKCMGARQDGRRDDQYANDIDFGSAHPTSATPEECRVIGNWIDQGIQRGFMP